MAARGVTWREPKQPKEVVYRDALDNVSAFNARLCFERKMRAPFLDAQTGIAMNNCHLWLSKFMRREPATSEYIYTYPAKRWRKKKRVYQPEKVEEDKGGIDEAEPSSFTEGEGEQAIEHVESAVLDSSKEESREEEVVLEVSDAEEEVEEQVSSDEEDMELGKRKRGRPGRKKGYQVQSSVQLHPVPRPSPMFAGSMIVRNITKEELGRLNPEDRKKPYVCEICGRRYKNGPGLKYHYTHYNHDLDSTTVQEEPTISLPSTPAAATVVDSPKPPSPMPRGPGRPRRPDMPTHSVTPNSYCDFCLGDVYENKKSGRPEELLSCSDCGRSGHPSCLQFTPKLTYNVKKYRWQCIECKSCTLCGTSDNDDQLLFCDDCDRGYHMYCLNPPMDKPPEGHWMCGLCKAAMVMTPSVIHMNPSATATM